MGDFSASAAARSGLVVLALFTGALTGCAPVADQDPAAGGVPPGAVTPTGEQPALPSGWRWESYGGVQVGVPADWGWGNGSQRLGQWCVDRQAGGTGAPPGPQVGRPGAATLVGCPDDGTPGPGTLVEKTGQVVAFDRTEDASAGIEHEGDRTTVRLNGVLVIVQTPAELRQRIVATVHPVELDSFGCPSTHPVSTAASHRPARPTGVQALREVTEVSACRYQLGADGRLLSALRLAGAPAAEAVRRIAAAPVGGGPDSPTDCLPESAYGDEIIVLRVRSSAGLTEIVLRYAGCDHHGFDDGQAVRSLTAPAVAALLAAPNSLPGQWQSVGRS